MGSTKFDGAYISFNSYATKLKPYLEQILSNSFLHKKWRGKDKPIKNKNDLLANLETRIEINEKKK